LPAPNPARGWRETVALYREPQMLVLLLLGFSSGLPIVLIGGTLTIWLREAEVSRAAIGLFAYAFAPYTFKFAWAPILDRVPIPWLTARLGRRRSWMLVAQAGLVASIWLLGRADPTVDLAATALAALAVAFFSASQDVVIDAYRVEILPRASLGAGAGVAIVGYRLGMWVAGAGALFLADRIGWSTTYAAMALCVLVGVGTALAAPEPAYAGAPRPAGERRFGTWLRAAVIEPFEDFFLRQGLTIALAILLFISLYKACDVLLTLMAGVFYVDLGFTKSDIAQVSGTFGLFATLAGGLAGGALVFRLGILRSLLVAGVLQALSNLMFASLAVIGPSKAFYVLTVAVENFSGGMGNAAFIAYLSSLCNLH
jgi:PAT family beta-lactamase induction signal transducer AmpG